MRILYEKEMSNTLPNSSVALGSFEALHAGHLKIIKKTVQCADKNELESVVTIFKNPILKKRAAVCETLEDRLYILEKLNVKNVVIFEFDDKFRKMTDLEFFDKIICKKLGAKHIFAGFNYKFGHNASGDIDKLSKLCNENNINLDIIPPVKIGTLVSSSRIYELILSGNAAELFNCLDRPYSISGNVIHGRRIGHKLGFPTANIKIPENKAIIANGVYFGKCHIADKSYFCIINVGLQPTVTEEITPKIEVYILNFENNIYDKNIKIDFYEKIRDTIAFKNTEELKQQLNFDKLHAYELSEKYK